MRCSDWIIDWGKVESKYDTLLGNKWALYNKQCRKVINNIPGYKEYTMNGRLVTPSEQ